MAGAATEHEGVPDGMVVAKPMPEIEYDAEGIAESAREQQPQSAVWYTRDHRLERNHDQPADEQIG